MSTPRNDDSIEQLVEAAMSEVEEMERDFTGWLSREAPRWRALGHDETWIRLRMQLAQAMRQMNRMMKTQGYAEDQRRAAIRSAFADSPAKPQTPLLPPSGTPTMFEEAVTRIGTEMGTTIFEVTPRTTREQFLAALALLMEEEFGVSQERQSANSRATLLALATEEFLRLGGVFASEKLRRRSGKQRGHGRKSARRKENG